MMQFDLVNFVFDNYQLDDDNNPIIKEGWIQIDTQDQIDQISESITNNGTVWVEDGELRTSGKSPSPYHTWDINSKDWVINHELKEASQNHVWELIKQKRFDNTRGGVYISSVGKWFHNDDPSRTQYLALQVLSNHPEKLMWKTMDNSFVHMTKDLLYEIASTMLAEEQQDFANAERHRLAMLESDNPLEYDFSDGWSATYEPE